LCSFVYLFRQTAGSLPPAAQLSIQNFKTVRTQNGYNPDFALRKRGAIRHVQTSDLQQLAMTDSYCVALELNKTVSDLRSVPSPMQNPGYNLTV
jgi:hypothetical protein